MDFQKLIETRETLRNFDPGKNIDDAVLYRILDAGRLAPSASNRQPWTFVLVSTPQKLMEVKATYQREWFQKVPYIVAVVGDKTKSWVKPSDGYNSIETDLAIAMDHIILAAANEGVGACWVIAFEYDKLAQALNLNKDEVVFAIAALGYPPDGYQQSGIKKRKPIEDIIKRI